MCDAPRLGRQGRVPAARGVGLVAVVGCGLWRGKEGQGLGQKGWARRGASLPEPVVRPWALPSGAIRTLEDLAHKEVPPKNCSKAEV